LLGTGGSFTVAQSTTNPEMAQAQDYAIRFSGPKFRTVLASLSSFGKSASGHPSRITHRT
ncbi:MAG TPA: hypothetical protein VN541_14715, partial [Tepidisphaeraceae bacterium]|nr:hypothetical protein [Tepidisphaeraceae bacterium]